MMKYQLSGNIFYKQFSDGVVIYNDNNGDTHKVDTLTGAVIDKISQLPLSIVEIGKQLTTEITDIDNFIQETINLLLSHQIIYQVDTINK